MYAAQPHEPTLEMPLPRGAEEAEWRGLLTYTMINVLISSPEPLSYRELNQRIHSEYTQSYGRLGPTPLIEGLDQQQQVLGDSKMKPRSQVFLTRNQQDQMSINAGRLHGFDKGTVFAVFPPPGAQDAETALGYIQTDKAKLASSKVIPVSYKNQESNDKLPIGGVANRSRSNTEACLSTYFWTISRRNQVPRRTRWSLSCCRNLSRIPHFEYR